MKQIGKLLSVVAVMVACTLSVFAQKDYVPDVPTIPVEVMAQGRQAVVDYLNDRIEIVETYLDGQSVVGQYSSRHRLLNLDQLQELGYHNRGVFDELATAIGKVEYYANVVELPSGYYDVRVDLSLKIRNAKGEPKTALRGSGYLDLVEGDDGDLHHDGTFRPWVYFEGEFGIMFSEDITAARWLKNNGGWQDLPVYYDADGKAMIVLDDQKMENGTLAVTANGKGGEYTYGIDLSTGGRIEGKEIFSRLGKAGSPDILVLKNLSSIEQVDGVEFYRGAWWDGAIYGRMPMIEFHNDRPFRGKIWFSIPIWGSELRVYPSQVIVVPKVTSGDLQIGRRYTVSPGSIANLPPGVYHIFTSFDGVKDRSQNEYGGKGG